MKMRRIAWFRDLKADDFSSAGGKGKNLAIMFQSGFPVPEGFVVLPAVFRDNRLRPDAWNEIRTCLDTIRRKNRNARFAVRSSALNEDSEHASFAGAYESVLDVGTDDEIRNAIAVVCRSGTSERVSAYGAAQGIAPTGEIAVVVQLMVAPEISGVLFTVDPVTGSHGKMTGNCIDGLGDRLVSGAADARPFSLSRPKGRYDGPKDLKRYAPHLYRFAKRLESRFGRPQDIEWAAAKGRLYLLQTRPVTNIRTGDLRTYAWNDSMDGDFIWVNTNLAEAVPNVMTPLIWSVMRFLDNEQGFIPGWYLCSGNICGKIYTNVSALLSFMSFAGINIRKAADMVRDVFGEIPAQMNIPVYPYTFPGILKEMLPKAIAKNKKSKKACRNIPQFLKDAPGWCIAMTDRIKNTKTREELSAIWRNELRPALLKAWFIMLKGSDKHGFVMTLRRTLVELTGTEEFCSLIDDKSADSGMASLDPVLGIAKIIKGELSREDYVRLYGHHAMQAGVRITGPDDENDWLNRMIADFKNAGTNVENLFAKKRAHNEELWKRFAVRYPRKVKWLRSRIDKASAFSLRREATRSEYVRVSQVFGTFALKAGEHAGIGDDVAFLYLDELIDLVAGDTRALENIPARKTTCRTYQTLPPLPSVIRGRFDPFQWAQDPNRRIEFHDSSIPFVRTDAKMIKGFAGASGRVKGVVRVISNLDHGFELRTGEILVTSTTNIGWTPLFPRAAAVVTDIGAPLSHAAIVARELGIPAVVGCGTATAILKSGDIVIVDGGQGIVQLVDETNS